MTGNNNILNLHPLLYRLLSNTHAMGLIRANDVAPVNMPGWKEEIASLKWAIKKINKMVLSAQKAKGARITEEEIAVIIHNEKMDPLLMTSWEVLQGAIGAETPIKSATS